MNRGLISGIKQLFIPPNLGGGDPANDGATLGFDSTQPGGVKPVQSGTYVQLNQTLPTIPIYCLGSLSSPALAAIASSWWVLDPAQYPTVSGKTLQLRFHAIANSLTAADTFGAAPYDAGATGLLFAETTVAAIDGNGTEVVSSWQTFPVARKNGYIQARNATATRGTIVSAYFELRFN